MSRNFIQTLADINAGKVVEELTDKLENLVREVARVQSGGKLRLTLTIKPNKGGLTVSLDHDVDVTLPEMERATDFFFIGKDHSLLRHHPDQQKLDLVAVDRTPGEIVTMQQGNGPAVNVDRMTGEVVG